MSSSSEQTEIYDICSRLYQQIHHNLYQALEKTNQGSSQQAKTNAIGAFESNKQKFFNQLSLSMKLPTLIADLETQLAAGNSAVIQLINTNEGVLKRKLATVPVEQWSDLRSKISPKEYILDYLENSFPTELYEIIETENGNIVIPARDQNGQKIQNNEALALKNQMIEDLLLLPAIATALDQIINYFGQEKVAEVTGRSVRLVRQNNCLKVEKRSQTSNLAEIESFRSGKKEILVFSNAGGTGASYHADSSHPNQKRRIHYILQAGWEADKAIQGLGRTHRSNQFVAPEYVLVTSSVKGEIRFISTIAQRLDSLGALTKGERSFESSNWEEIDLIRFKKLWQLEVDQTPKTNKSYFYLITGLLLPIWKKLENGNVRIWRIFPDEYEGSLLGRKVSVDAMESIAGKFNSGIQRSPEEILASLNNKSDTTLNIDLKIRKSLIMGETRIEIIGCDKSWVERLRAWNCFTEIINRDLRVFVPENKALEVIKQIQEY